MSYLPLYFLLLLLGPLEYESLYAGWFPRSHLKRILILNLFLFLLWKQTKAKVICTPLSSISQIHFCVSSNLLLIHSNIFLTLVNVSFRSVWFFIFSHGGLVTKSCLTLVTLWTVDCQAPLSMGFSRQEYQSHLIQVTSKARDKTCISYIACIGSLVTWSDGTRCYDISFLDVVF